MTNMATIIPGDVVPLDPIYVGHSPIQPLTQRDADFVLLASDPGMLAGHVPDINDPSIEFLDLNITNTSEIQQGYPFKLQVKRTPPHDPENQVVAFQESASSPDSLRVVSGHTYTLADPAFMSHPSGYWRLVRFWAHSDEPAGADPVTVTTILTSGRLDALGNTLIGVPATVVDDFPGLGPPGLYSFLSYTFLLQVSNDGVTWKPFP